MEMLLAILLWISCIFPHGVYTEQQINGYATQNEQVIEGVLQNQTQQTTIWDTYGPAVPTIEIIDPY